MIKCIKFKIAFGALFSLFIGCMQTYNSNTGDVIYAQNTCDGGALNQVCAVLNDRCISCHTGYHNNWASFTTNEKWQQSGLITIGNPNSSTLYQRIRNVGGDMPPTGTGISETELTTLRTWIETF